MRILHVTEQALYFFPDNILTALKSEDSFNIAWNVCNKQSFTVNKVMMKIFSSNVLGARCSVNVITHSQ